VIVKINLGALVLLFSKKKPTTMQKIMNSMFKQLDSLYSIFGGRTIALLSFALIIAMMTIFFSDSWITKMKTKDAEITEIRKAMFHLSELEANVYAAESAQRGYLVTNENQYLRPYDDSLTIAKAHINGLETFIEKNRFGAQKQKEKDILDKVSSNFESKVAEMGLTIKLVDKGDQR
jgi:CHASE3 domain sensor protein